MKNKYAIFGMFFLGLFIFLLIIFSMKVLSEEKPSVPYEPEIKLIAGYTTAYTAKPDAKTCTGKTVRKGICGGYGPYIGKTIILYKRLPDNTIGECLGVFECEDTGTGTKSFQEGKLIDVFQPTKEDVQKWADLTWADGCNGHVWIQVIDAKG